MNCDAYATLTDYYTTHLLGTLAEIIERVLENYSTAFGLESATSSNLHSIGHIPEQIKYCGTFHDQTVCSIQTCLEYKFLEFTSDIN